MTAKTMRVSTFSSILSAFEKHVLDTHLGLSWLLGRSRRRLSGARGTSDGCSYGPSVHRSIFQVNSTFGYTLALILLALPAFGQVPVQVGPEPQTQFLDMSGAPLAFGIVCTYQAGTSTPFATYTDSTGSVMNANPTVLDAGGRANIWWQSPAYKVVLAGGGTCASPSNLQWTVDNFSVGVFAAGNTTFSGNNTFNGTSTFNGAVTITNGGTFNGTFAGNPTFSGTVTFSGSLSVSQLQLTVATGTPPLVVTSTTVVPNLNVEVINGVAYPASPALHSVPVATAANVVSYKVVPDCGAVGDTLLFTQATNVWSCGTATPGAVDCPSTKKGYALTFTASTWSCTEIIAPVLKKGTNGGDYSTSSTSYVDVDNTNLKDIVTIPSGSNLVIQVSGSMTLDTGGASGMFVALADGGTAISGPQVASVDTGGTPSQNPFSLTWVIAGDGASHTITLQYKMNGGSASSAKISNASGFVPMMLFTLQ